MYGALVLRTFCPPISWFEYKLQHREYPELMSMPNNAHMHT